MGGAHSDVSKHIRAYLLVFGALAVFTVLTVAASYIKVSMPTHIGIALVIAAVKATMVAAIFMHLKWERGLSIWVTLAFCAIFFITLLLLPVLTSVDLPPKAQHGMWG